MFREVNAVSHSDTAAESDVLHLICEETRLLGHVRGRKVLDDLQLRPTDFDDAAHRTLFAAIERIVGEGLVPDVVQLKRAAPELNGQVEKFCAYDGRVLSWEQCEGLADHLRDLSRRRALQSALDAARGALHKGEAVTDVLGRVGRELAAIPSLGPTWLEPEESVRRLDEHLRAIQEGKTVAFLPTGIAELDERIGGFWADLNVINARGGVGKSGLAARVAKNLSLRGVRTLWFLPEDGLRGMRIRHLAEESGVDMRTLLSRNWGEYRAQAVREAKARVAAWPGALLIDETRGLTASEVLHRSRVAVLTRGVGLIGLDNMTAMHWPRSERSDLDREDFCRQAGELAQELGVPFVLLTHVKSSVSEDKVPTLEDCTESGGMSKVARIGIGLARAKGAATLTCGISKGTFAGPGGETVELAFDGPVGMVAQK